MRSRRRKALFLQSDLALRLELGLGLVTLLESSSNDPNASAKWLMSSQGRIREVEAAKAVNLSLQNRGV